MESTFGLTALYVAVGCLHFKRDQDGISSSRRALLQCKGGSKVRFRLDTSNLLRVVED